MTTVEENSKFQEINCGNGICSRFYKHENLLDFCSKQELSTVRVGNTGWFQERPQSNILKHKLTLAVDRNKTLINNTL